jgi:hypothetical protein
VLLLLLPAAAASREVIAYSRNQNHRSGVMEMF